MNKIIMFHHLRNPSEVPETEMREARLQAADELERLYKIERSITVYLDKLKELGQTLDNE